MTQSTVNPAMQQFVDHARNIAVKVREKYHPEGPSKDSALMNDSWHLACAVQALCNALQAGGFVR